MQLGVSFPSVIASAAQLLKGLAVGHKMQSDFRRQALVLFCGHRRYSQPDNQVEMDAD